MVRTMWGSAACFLPLKLIIPPPIQLRPEWIPRPNRTRSWHRSTISKQRGMIIVRHLRELAGVIVEPLQRCLSPVRGFLSGVREITRDAGIPLIFDEVVTGFRLAYGGAQEYYGVEPDLVAYGKALGGGLPLGAYGGRRA